MRVAGFVFGKRISHVVHCIVPYYQIVFANGSPSRSTSRPTDLCIQRFFLHRVQQICVSNGCSIVLSSKSSQRKMYNKQVDEHILMIRVQSTLMADLELIAIFVTSRVAICIFATALLQ